jgi:hypothetical protein
VKPAVTGTSVSEVLRFKLQRTCEGEFPILRPLEEHLLKFCGEF